MQNCLAKALYDNNSESPDELAFRKGDVLTVLEQNPGGLEGWWLCSLRGRQGIAPGNRLRLMPGRYDSTGLGYAGSSSSPSSGSTGSLKMSSSSPPPRPSTPSSQTSSGCRRRSWHINSNKVVIPQRIGDVYLYDVPVGTGVASYDIPVPRQVRSTTSTPSPKHSQLSFPTAQPKSPAPCYDVPINSVTGKTDRFENCITLMNGKSSSSEILVDDCKKSDTDSAGVAPAYDVPLAARKPAVLENGCNYDVPPPPVRVVDNEPVSDVAYDVPKSNRSSGVISQISSSSLSLLSPQSNCSSLGASFSFSSHGGSNRSSLEQTCTGEVYDIPPPGNPRPVPGLVGHSELKRTTSPPPMVGREVEPKSPSSVAAEECYDFPNSNASLTSQIPQVYDLPKNTCSRIKETSQDQKRASTYSNESRDSAAYSSISSDIAYKTLNIDLNEGILCVVKHQQLVHGAINDLFTLITKPNWRHKENLPGSLTSLQDACYRLRSSLKDFLDFSNGVYANALTASDKTLSSKMSNLLLQLGNSNSIIQTATAAIDAKGWTVERLAIPAKGSSPSSASKTPDELDQLVACARGLTEDVKHINSFIRGNAKLLFKEPACETMGRQKPAVLPKPTAFRSLPSIPPPAPPKNPNLQSRPLPPVPPTSTESKVVLTEDEVDSGTNDYDYVSLESKESVKSKDLRIIVPEVVKDHQEKDGGKVGPEEDSVPTTPRTKKEVSSVYGRLCDAFSVEVKEAGLKSFHQSDTQLLLYYCAQLELHKCFLNNAIDAFICTINQNEPPKVFIEHSKFIIIAAQKMIYMGDTVCRNVSNDLRAQIANCATSLCDHLKALVINTKKAALQFPSVTAVQEMVDCVVDVSHAANNLYNTMIKSV